MFVDSWFIPMRDGLILLAIAVAIVFAVAFGIRWLFRQ